MSDVCAFCEKISEQFTFLPCFKCLQLCCSRCLFYRKKDKTIDRSRLIQLCFKCLSSATSSSPSPTATGKTETMDQSNTISSEANQDLCKLHQKVCKLFCQNCSIGICATCMDGEQHDLHQVTNLAVVYREKLSNVESKLVKAEQNDALRSGCDVYQKNLAWLEQEEAFVRKEIEAIAEESQLEVSTMTNIRKKTLREKLELPAENATRLRNLRSDVERLSANEFVQQYPEIDKKCDGLIGAFSDAPEAVTLQSVDDIECGLIPPYQFQTVVYKQLMDAATNSSQVFSLKSAHDVEWKVTVSKSAMVQIRSEPSDPQLLTFRHMMIVIIPHSEYSKQFRQTFELDVCHNKFDVVLVSHISEQGFCNDKGDLVMKIGIRPLNVLIEKQLLAYQYEQQKGTIDELSQQLRSVTDKYDYNHYIMHFKPKLSGLKKDRKLLSLRIRENEDRQWRLVVQLTPDGFVTASIQLFDGSDIDCSNFVELMHVDPEKTVVCVSELTHFDINSLWGWDLMTLEELKNDIGFHPDGYLHFRFGVRPLSKKCSSGGSGAAKA